MSGQECSSTKVVFICAVRVPGGVNCRGNVYGHRIRRRSHGIIMYKNKNYIIMKLFESCENQLVYHHKNGGLAEEL